MAKRRVPKGTDIYINDHLSSYNNELFCHARQLKKGKHFQCVDTALLRLHKGKRGRAKAESEDRSGP